MSGCVAAVPALVERLLAQREEQGLPRYIDSEQLYDMLADALVEVRDAERRESRKLRAG